MAIATNLGIVIISRFLIFTKLPTFIFTPTLVFCEITLLHISATAVVIAIIRIKCSSILPAITSYHLIINIIPITLF